MEYRSKNRNKSRKRKYSYAYQVTIYKQYDPTKLTKYVLESNAISTSPAAEIISTEEHVDCGIELAWSFSVIETFFFWKRWVLMVPTRCYQPARATKPWHCMDATWLNESSVFEYHNSCDEKSISFFVIFPWACACNCYGDLEGISRERCLRSPMNMVDEFIT